LQLPRTLGLTQHNHRHFFESIPTLLSHASNVLLSHATRWHVFDPIRNFCERPLMSKKTSDSISKKGRRMIPEPTPPLLSEKLIAQLQGAVTAAQHKRNSQPIEPAAGSSPEEDV
jgi:hypothetical protein